jgi:hypothetical protein
VPTVIFFLATAFLPSSAQTAKNTKMRHRQNPTMAMSVAAIPINLPHSPLTKITGKPSHGVVIQLHKELWKNAMSIRSAHGGGQCSHLGMIMPPAKHNAMSGTQPWVDPPHPGALQLPANATQCQIATAANTCNCNAKHWNTWINLTNKLKQQVLGAADKDELAGCAARSTGELLNHLVTRCSQIKCGGIKNNKEKLTADWSPANGLEELWVRARQRCQFADIAQEPIPDGELLGDLPHATEAMGVFLEGCKEWHKHPVVEQTCGGFKVHFQPMALVVGLLLARLC